MGSKDKERRRTTDDRPLVAYFARP